MNWNQLDQTWQIVFRQAWNAYNKGTFPIGAVITDGDGNLIAHGKNTIYSPTSRDNPVSGHQLGHAEINAMLQVSKHDHPEITSYTLFTSLEPCIACFGCFTMSRIMNLKFAARDNFAGATEAKDQNGYIENRGLTVQGPMPFLEDFQMVLLSEFIARSRPHDISRILIKWHKQSPLATDLGRDLAKSGELQKLSRAGARIEQVWELINSRILGLTCVLKAG